MSATDPSSVFRIERPHRNLLTYYVLRSLVLGPLFPLALLPLYFRYHTMRYRFDEEGISMRWGILFRKEVNLTYARIQDIHLTSNFVERWLDLARIEVQTASGSSKAEMTIEGVLEYEAVRDFLYSRMRGLRERPSRPALRPPSASPSGALAPVLFEIAEELRAVRRALERRENGP